MRPLCRPGNDLQPRPSDKFARGVFFTLVPAGGLVVAGLVSGLIAAAVSA